MAIMKHLIMPSRPSYMPKYYPTPSSCILYLEGQQDAYSSTIRDLSGYGNHGTIYGATWARLPSGLWVNSFDGVDDFINCGAGSSLDFDAGNFSGVIWFNADVVQDNALFGRGKSLVDGWWFRVNYPGYIILSTNQLGTKDESFCSTAALVAGKWYMATFTRNGTSVRVYLNGVDRTDTADSHVNPLTSVFNFGVGAFHGSATNGEFFDGLLWGCRIYNNILTPTQLTQIFNSERHLFGV